MNQENLKLLSSVLIITIFQIGIFNNMNLFNLINPSFYLLIFILYRTTFDRTLFILLGFFIGLLIDLTSQTYGCHTIATITICFSRELIEKYSFGVNANLPKPMISGTVLTNRLFFFFSIVLIHQLIYFSLVFFSFSFISTIIFYTLLNSIVSFIVIWMTTKIFYEKKR